ncbi:MAG TPA: ABC-2 family transporter protein [Ktedonobacteraceae bacterium]|jgi:ABC-2 type transport system permease protein
MMNVRAIWLMTRGIWMSWMQGRGFFFLLAFGWMMPPLVSLFIWYTAAGSGTVGGLTQDELVTYYLFFIPVNQMTYSQTNWTVGDAIREGNINISLLRPISFHWSTVASELAGKVVFMTFVLPFVLVMALLLHPDLHLRWPSVLLFLPTFLLTWALRFFWGYWLALLAFWVTRADALLTLQYSLTFLFAGVVAPIAFLPGPLQYMARILPFRYMISFPVEILSNQLSRMDVLIGLCYQCGWLALSLVLFALLWHTGVRRYSAIGG